MFPIVSTASGVVCAGDNEGNFMAFDARSGKNLWFYPTGAPIWGAAPMTFMVDGRQHVVIGSGTTVTAFALPSVPTKSQPSRRVVATGAAGPDLSRAYRRLNGCGLPYAESSERLNGLRTNGLGRPASSRSARSNYCRSAAVG
jgi:outer membrane protein assembly factor BamB